MIAEFWYRNVLESVHFNVEGAISDVCGVARFFGAQVITIKSAPNGNYKR